MPQFINLHSVIDAVHHPFYHGRINHDKEHRYSNRGKTKQGTPHVTPNVSVGDFYQRPRAAFFIFVCHITSRFFDLALFKT
jgi:hypothetical protein